MNTERHNRVLDSSTIPTTTQATCKTGSCRTGICSPCLIVWGLAIVWLIVNALWERFQ
ncbi:hypothetical protein [Schlesneria sp. T3-172]|uniref:hypothetical protein n=1 Tax=Schlesneria sphaerica TaxID=3373610 RepID=UPI0037C6A7D2